MQTKLLQARHLHAGDSIVEGGEGVRRATHKIQELQVIPYVNPKQVIAITPTGLKRYEFEPKQTVRVLL